MNIIKDKNILIAGGDLRQVTIAKLFAKNNNVFCVGLEQSTGISELKHDILSLILSGILFDYIILPMPLSVDNNLVCTPFSNTQLLIDDVLSLCEEKTILFGGKISPVLQEHFVKRKIKFHDYLLREELAILNAQVTAEGALQIMMEELPITIFSSNCLVVGNGRIGKILSSMLLSLGCDVTVCARSFKDLALIETSRLKPIHISALKSALKKKHCIINTVPAVLFTKDVLAEIDTDCLLLDLASKPGGIDLTAASQMGINAIWALSLPGKVAPITAGEIVYKTILNIESERSNNDE